MIGPSRLRRTLLSTRIRMAKPAAFIEELESRVLLSVSHAVETHDFVISRSAHSNVRRAAEFMPQRTDPRHHPPGLRHQPS